MPQRRQQTVEATGSFVANSNPMQSYIRNLLSSWGGFASQIVLTFCLTPIVLESLGEVRYGLWALMINFVGYYGLLDIGFRPGATKFLSAAVGANDKNAGTEVLTSAFFSMALVGAGIICLSIPAAYFAAEYLATELDLRNEAFWCILIMGLGAGVQFPLSVFGSLLVAEERYDISNGVAVFSRTIYAITAVFALTEGYGMVVLSVLLVSTNTLDYLLRYYFSRRLTPHFRIRLSCWSSRVTKQILQFGTWMSLASTGTRIAQYSDTLIIGTLVSVNAIAAYSLAASMVGHVSKIIMPMSMILFPAAVKLVAKSATNELKQTYLKATRLIMGLSVTVTCICWFYFKPFLSIWLGDTITQQTLNESMSAFGFLSISTIAISWQQLGRQVLMALGKPKTVALLLLPEAIINVVLSIILAQKFGMLGVVSATLISTGGFHFFIHPIVVGRTAGINTMMIVTGTLPRSLFLLPLLFLLFDLSEKAFGIPSTWAALFLHAAATSAFASVLTALIVFNGDERSRLWSVITSRLNHKIGA